MDSAATECGNSEIGRRIPKRGPVSLDGALLEITLAFQDTYRRE